MVVDVHNINLKEKVFMANSKKSVKGALASAPVAKQKTGGAVMPTGVSGAVGPTGGQTRTMAAPKPVTGQRPPRFTYVRNRKNQPVGVICCLEQLDGTVAVGYSLCAVKRGDTFNKDHGRTAATARAAGRQLYVNKKNQSVLRGALEGIAKPNPMDVAMATLVMNSSKLVHVRMVRNVAQNKSVRETIAHTVVSYAKNYLEARKASELARKNMATLAASEGRNTVGT